MLARRFYLFLALFIAHSLEAECIIDDIYDALYVTLNLAEYLLRGDEVPREANKRADAIELPWLRDRQEKVIAQIKVVSRDIEKMTDMHSHYMAAFSETAMNSFISSSQAIMLFVRIEKIQQRIDSMYRHMLLLERNFEKLETSTLLYMAKWFVNPNSESIGHLLNILHLLLMGNGRDKRSGLEVIAKYYQHAEQIALAIESVNNFIEGNLQLLSKRNDIADTMNRISSRFQQMQQYELHQDKLETSTLLTFAEWTVSPNAYSVHHLMDRLSLMMFGISDDKGNMTTSPNNMLEMMANSYQASKEERCLNQQSTQQFLYSLYTDIALTELKGYTMMEFSWMILRVHGKGNFTQEAELMRNDFERRTDKAVRLLREVMNRADRIVWRCDPPTYVAGKTYDEVTRLLQGYIENEVDMNYNRECWQTCEDYSSTKNEGCFKDKFCARQERCTGNIHSCRRFDSDMTICPAPRDSQKRYEFVEYENGVTLGQPGFCSRGKTAVDSWWRYLFWHCTYCFCLCDDQYSSKTDRYFNLRETTTNVNENKVITGLRFTKRNRVFHLQVQEGQLLPRGRINESTLAWIPVDNYTLNDRNVRNNRDYYTLSYGARSVDLDDIHTEDNTFVVTGVRFRSVGAHLNLEACLSEFNFETGQLVSPQENSFWKSNDNTDVSGDRRAKVELVNPDVPTRTKAKSVPDSRHNQYIEFTASDVYKDASQSTVPFIDTQDVISRPAVPLAGIGIYHKGRPGYGGFLAPKLMTYDFTPHIRAPRRVQSTLTPPRAN